MYTARPELGIKRTCAHCAVRFYDLGRAPAQCPACGGTQPPPRARAAPVPRGAGARWSARPAPEMAAPGDDAVPLLDTPGDEAGDEEDDAVDDAPEDTDET